MFSGLQSSVCGELYKVTRGGASGSTVDTLAQVTTKSHSSECNGTSEFIHPDNSDTRENSVYGVEYHNRLPPALFSGNLKNQTDQNVVESSHGQCPETNKLIMNNGQSESPPLDLTPRSSSSVQYFELTQGIKEALSCNLNPIESTYGEQNGHFRVHFVNNTQVSEVISSSMTDNVRSITPPPPYSPPAVVSLGLDLTLETITRYQSKPNDMYTFLCGQEFRRDEYSWHYKNVHNDIHGGLNGWLEHRCPLAHYGCMYSLRRFYPTVKGATVIHNETLESFGVKPFVPYDIPVLNRCSKVTKSVVQSVSHKKPNNFSGLQLQNLENTQDWSVISSQPVVLCQLPFEVLRHVCRFLDSFRYVYSKFGYIRMAVVCMQRPKVCAVHQLDKNSTCQKFFHKGNDSYPNHCNCFEPAYLSHNIRDTKCCLLHST